MMMGQFDHLFWVGAKKKKKKCLCGGMIDLTQMSIHMPLGLYLCFLSLSQYEIGFLFVPKTNHPKK